jgi:conjugal transfer pilus assembly protein TraV
MHHRFLKHFSGKLKAFASLSSRLGSLLGSLSVCLGLCGCSTTSETFDCPAGKGVGCKSISAVNKMVDQGMLGDGIQEAQPVSLPPTFTNAPKLLNAQMPLSDDFFVQRVQEEHLRVWIAPYQDAQGNFHEGSIVHTVLTPGSWNIQDPGNRGQELGKQPKRGQ